MKAIGTGLVTDLTKIEFREVHVFDVADYESDGAGGDGKKNHNAVQILAGGIKRYIGAQLHLNGVYRPEWYLEITSMPTASFSSSFSSSSSSSSSLLSSFTTPDHHAEGGEGVEGGRGGYYIALATEREALSKEDMEGMWEEIDYERDILCWAGGSK